MYKLQDTIFCHLITHNIDGEVGIGGIKQNAAKTP